MDIFNFEKFKLNEETNYNYSKWVRNNVTYRGIVDSDSEENFNGASLGHGLYSTKDKSMARKYGKLHYLVNAIPKNPKKFKDLNEWQVFYYNNLVKPKYKDSYEFSENTNITEAMQNLGYDGIIIVGREMVNYTPENVIYFHTEIQLYNYYIFKFES
jgi:hypothetical protein